MTTYEMFSIRRSGTHAVSGWILELLTGRDVRYVNNASAFTRKYRKPREYTLRSHENVPSDRISELLRGYGEERSIVMIRDVFNLGASKVAEAVRYGAAWEGRLKETIELWRDYAWGYVNSHYNEAVVILFNEWFESPQYRVLTANRLGLVSNGRAYQKVRYHGGGSSFDGRDFDGRASEMRVLDRWREHLEPAYKAAFDDEVVGLNEVIFGFGRPWEGGVAVPRGLTEEFARGRVLRGRGYR